MIMLWSFARGCTGKIAGVETFDSLFRCCKEVGNGLLRIGCGIGFGRIERLALFLLYGLTAAELGRWHLVIRMGLYELLCVLL